MAETKGYVFDCAGTMLNEPPAAFLAKNGEPPWFVAGVLEKVLIYPRRPWIGRFTDDGLVEFVKYADEA